jgi:hypothetical protein
MPQLTRVVVLAAGALVLSCCGDDTPDLSMFIPYVMQETNAECAGKCQFVSATKTDGQKQGPVYQMNANVSLKVLRDLSYVSPGAMSGFIAIADSNFGMFPKKARQGDVLNLPVILHFQKFESGWKINQIQRRM